ncbi:hypothetical protein [Paenibacillus agricola]|uniref:Uncharacterized protein n=1 Tax=Paenibacillus agricola TaxID=2716264 RepID=A0ABX0JHK5_9BACL|nr:hypothetical protein [Paenibacillus agricola]NHN34407.1 hypothetical protein [Paenibacillus agricola]
MNNNDDLQRLLRQEYLIGPDYKMQNQIGINFYSGTKQSVFYELWGAEEIFRLLIFKPSDKLFTSKYVGKSCVLFQLLVEDEQIIGGFISFQEELYDQLTIIFPNFKEKSLRDLESLWTYFVKDHYTNTLQ